MCCEVEVDDKLLAGERREERGERVENSSLISHRPGEPDRAELGEIH